MMPPPIAAARIVAATPRRAHVLPRGAFDGCTGGGARAPAQAAGRGRGHRDRSSRSPSVGQSTTTSTVLGGRKLITRDKGFTGLNRPGFRAHSVTGVPPSLRLHAERSTRPRIRLGYAPQAVHQPAGVVPMDPVRGEQFHVGQPVQWAPPEG